jgi:hypothetical protein
MVILSPQMTPQIRPSFVDSQVCKILPIGPIMELFSEQQISLPNWLALPIAALWIPFKSAKAFFESPLF